MQNKTSQTKTKPETWSFSLPAHGWSGIIQAETKEEALQKIGKKYHGKVIKLGKRDDHIWMQFTFNSKEIEIEEGDQESLIRINKLMKSNPDAVVYCPTYR